MRAHSDQFNRTPTAIPQHAETVNRSSAAFVLVTALAMLLTITGLSSCAGYTSAAKASPTDPSTGVLSPSATSLTFGSVAVGSTATQSLTVTNTGTGTVTISQATLTGAGFAVIGGNPSGTIAV